MRNKLIVTVLSLAAATLLFTGCSDDAKGVAESHVKAWVSGDKAAVEKTMNRQQAKFLDNEYDKCIKKGSTISPYSPKGKKILEEENALVEKRLKDMQAKYSKEELNKMSTDKKMQLIKDTFAGTVLEGYENEIMSGKRLNKRQEQEIEKKLIANYIKKHKDEYKDVEKICTANFFTVPDIKKINVIGEKKEDVDKEDVKLEIVKKNGDTQKVNVKLEKFNGEWKVTESTLLQRVIMQSLMSGFMR